MSTAGQPHEASSIRGTCAALALLILPAWAATAEGSACWAICARGTACALSPLPDETQRGREPRLNDQMLHLVQNCGARQVAKGDVMVRYRHQKRMFVTPTPLKPDAKVADLFASRPPDACSVTTLKCLQHEMQVLKASAGGHGIDGQASAPAGQGEPCSLGLPCGTVMPPPPSWQFRLEDSGFDGIWRTQILRGQAAAGRAAQNDAAVAGGVVSADGSSFAPGVTYAYALVSKDGTTRASGEFTVQSSAQHAALRRLVDKRIEAGLPEAAAWLDALAANQLDWDAIQQISR